MSKEEIILLTARELFFKYGVKKVSVEEIAEKAAVSKATFYKYFSNKTALATRVITDIFEDDQSYFLEISNADMPFREKIKTMIAAKEKLFLDRSDLFHEDITRNFPEIEPVVNKYRVEMHTLIGDFLKRAQKNGQIRKTFNVDFLSEILILLFRAGLHNNTLLTVRSKADFVRQVSELFFYGILENNEE